MKLRVGQTLRSVVDNTALVVVRCPDQQRTVACGGHEMSAEQAAGRVDVELLAIAAGDHQVTVDGTPVVQKSAKPLPASD